MCDDFSEHQIGPFIFRCLAGDPERRFHIRCHMQCKLSSVVNSHNALQLQYNEVDENSQKLRYIRKFVRSSHLEARENYIRNLEIVRYIASFVIPEFVISRFDCIYIWVSNLNSYLYFNLYFVYSVAPYKLDLSQSWVGRDESFGRVEMLADDCGSHEMSAFDFLVLASRFAFFFSRANDSSLSAQL